MFQCICIITLVCTRLRLPEDDADALKYVVVCTIYKILIYIYVVLLLVWIINWRKCTVHTSKLLFVTFSSRVLIICHIFLTFLNPNPRVSAMPNLHFELNTK